MEHHAYFYEGPLMLHGALAADARTRFGFIKSGNPDVHEQTWQKFGIDDARALAQSASLKSTGGHALFVLGLGSITTEAQQALLKLFEEPQAGTTFVVLVPHGVLLPTVRSRFATYPEKIELAGSSTGQPMAAEAKEFLSWSYKQRSDWITGFLKKDDDTVREQTRNFLNALEQLLYVRFSTISPSETESESARDIREGLQDLGHFRQYLADRSPSLKMILEHFAATLPATK
jgi:hypothetical protein